MALVFADGFDYYNTNAYMLQIWDSVTSGKFPSALSTGRFGTSRAFHNDSGGAGLYKNVPSQTAYVAAFAIRFSSVAVAVKFLAFQEGATVHVQVGLDSTGHIAVYRNGTLLGSAASSPLLANTWYHIQAKTLIDSTVGTYEVRVDGVTGGSNGVGAATGANTKNGGSGVITRISIGDGAGSQIVDLDDVIFLDTTGSLNNDFPGDCRIVATFPTGAGATTNWTPSTGSNWQNVDENPSNDDTDYNADSTVSDLDLYTRDAVTITGAVLGVKHSLLTRKDDAGARQVAGVCRSGSTNFVGATQTLGSGYLYTSDLYETDPNTSAAWTQTNLNNAQFGVKVIA